ncbi:MAG: 16S rRNA (guanine1516-N2)-methyltransferase [Paraglaciecola sp.]|jgi:16S rRNA (guanine1516-N2)-methyltransferase
MDTPEHGELIASLVVTTAAGADDECIARARDVAQKWQLPYASAADSGLALVQNSSHLQLKQLDEPKVGAVMVDFTSDALTYRRLHGGKKEAIIKAVGLKGHGPLRVLDATAGLGRDAFVLANSGCTVDMIERSPVVAALLNDGLQRAARDGELGRWLPQRMALYHGVSYALLADWPGSQPEVIYLDPMFPHRKKSALVKKEMRIFQQLLGPDEDADKLLAPALALASKRVVVKRPDHAPFLADRPPNMSISSKKHRFDVYLISP